MRVLTCNARQQVHLNLIFHWPLLCEMHVGHACHMHEPGTTARIWTCDAWWAAHIGAAHICNIVWCICVSNMLPAGALLSLVYMMRTPHHGCHDDYNP